VNFSFDLFNNYFFARSILGYDNVNKLGDELNFSFGEIFFILERGKLFFFFFKKKEYFLNLIKILMNGIFVKDQIFHGILFFFKKKKVKLLFFL
jgi:hypothetical protein